MRATSTSRGFTLMEVLVATTIMGIAVVGIFSALRTTIRNGARLTDHDRMVLVARAHMDELLTNYDLPFEGAVQGKLTPAETGGVEGGYQVTTSIFDAPAHVVPGTPILQRLELRVWWDQGGRHSFNLSSFRRNDVPLNQDFQ